ncbi:hypothetical protein BU16DRAFT_161058 [Lophium mytilinum]|uniref:Uncharacterized protein n=1 Tax=Lophium mytilinum TaxID=390894 RepID=A0A6A6QBV0_9PEZI|nr:hypothetical protein BU16DRAFT_161058 [Lophium mytilinum]
MDFSNNPVPQDQALHQQPPHDQALQEQPPRNQPFQHHPAVGSPLPREPARTNRFSLVNVSGRAKAFIGNFYGNIINNPRRKSRRERIAVSIGIATLVIMILAAVLVPLFVHLSQPFHKPSAEQQSISTVSLWYTATFHDTPVPGSPGSAYVSASLLSTSSSDSSRKDVEPSSDTSRITILRSPAFVLAQTTSTPGSQTPPPDVVTIQPSTKETVFAAAVTSFPASQTSSDSPRTTSILFGATGPVKTYLWDGTTTFCTRWSGLGCPGDQCNSNTCLDPLPCWEGRCCTSGCVEGWECTGTCVSAMSCVTTNNDSTGVCRYTA